MFKRIAFNGCVSYSMHVCICSIISRARAGVRKKAYASTRRDARRNANWAWWASKLYYGTIPLVLWTHDQGWLEGVGTRSRGVYGGFVSPTITYCLFRWGCTTPWYPGPGSSWRWGSIVCRYSHNQESHPIPYFFLVWRGTYGMLWLILTRILMDVRHGVAYIREHDRVLRLTLRPVSTWFYEFSVGNRKFHGL